MEKVRDQTIIRSARELGDLGEYLREKNPRLDVEFPEWKNLERSLAQLIYLGEIKVQSFVESDKFCMPLVTISLGSRDAKAPVLGFFGGVHGLERIGAQVVLTYLHTLSHQILWDKLTQLALEKVRLIFFPIVNPVGILAHTRSNPNGVDLMRNSAVDAGAEATAWVGGHRRSKGLPWYRGELGAPLEKESQTLIDFAQAEIQESESVLMLDVHSGFGLRDQIWFPFAHTSKPFPHLAEMEALRSAWTDIYPYQPYVIEPQAKIYRTHGDLWDYLYLEWAKKRAADSVFLPLCLEMGSFLWVKKNPWQLRRPFGFYNPIKKHRLERVLRRHLTFFDFLLRAQVAGGKLWRNLEPSVRIEHEERARSLWYST